jgi:hypothetical protein
MTNGDSEKLSVAYITYELGELLILIASELSHRGSFNWGRPLPLVPMSAVFFNCKMKK